MTEAQTQTVQPQATVAPAPVTPAPSVAPVVEKAEAKVTPKVDAVGEKILRERDEALAKLAEIQAQSEQAELDKAVQNKDVEALQKKYDGDLQGRDQLIRTLQQQIANDKRDLAVRDVVSDLFMDKHRRAGDAIVSKRIGATVNEKGEPELIIKDELGKPTKMDLEAFKKELQGDKELEDYLKGAEVGSGSTGNRAQVAPAQASGNIYSGGREPMLDIQQKFKAITNYKHASPTQLMEMAKARSGR